MIPGKDVDSLTGATLDFTESQGLVIRNPNRPAAPDIEGLIGDDELSAQVASSSPTRSTRRSPCTAGSSPTSATTARARRT